LGRLVTVLSGSAARSPRRLGRLLTVSLQERLHDFAKRAPRPLFSHPPIEHGSPADNSLVGTPVRGSCWSWPRSPYPFAARRRAGRQVFRHPCIQGRHYILGKLIAFHREHDTAIPEVLRGNRGVPGAFLVFSGNKPIMSPGPRSPNNQ
jgi:hypothetical protein